MRVVAATANLSSLPADRAVIFGLHESGAVPANRWDNNPHPLRSGLPACSGTPAAGPIPVVEPSLTGLCNGGWSQLPGQPLHR